MGINNNSIYIIYFVHIWKVVSYRTIAPAHKNLLFITVCNVVHMAVKAVPTAERSQALNGNSRAGYETGKVFSLSEIGYPKL